MLRPPTSRQPSTLGKVGGRQWITALMAVLWSFRENFYLIILSDRDPSSDARRRLNIGKREKYSMRDIPNGLSFGHLSQI